MPDSEAIHHG
jgi:hypothetical protein